MSGNSVTLVGNITRDPELRFTPSGQAMASFGLAVNRRWQDRQSGEWQEAVSFFDVVSWREMAENAAESLTKGARVVVTGRLEQRSWDNQQGEKQYKIEVIADDIGPSLRWATAVVTKNERRTPTDGGGGGGGGAPGGGGYSGGRDGGRPAPAPAPAGAGAGAGQGQSAPPYGSFDEEPF